MHGVEFPPDIDTVRSIVNKLDAFSESQPELSEATTENEYSAEWPTERGVLSTRVVSVLCTHKTYPRQHHHWTITWKTSNGPDGRDDQRIRRLLASLIARRLSDSQDAQRGSE